MGDSGNPLTACNVTTYDGIANGFRRISGIGFGCVGFIVSLNLKRRHLDTSQRAMVAARIANLSHGQKRADALNKATTQSDAANSLNVGRSPVQQARKVIDNGAPELIAAVESGVSGSGLPFLVLWSH